MIDSQDKEDIRSAKTPFLAAQIGRERTRSLRKDWEVVKEDEMLRALREKFGQHPDLREILGSTTGARLIEHTTNDSYWGDGGDGSGHNRLGTLLEQVRTECGAQTHSFLEPPWVKYPDIEVSDIFWRMGRGEDYLSQSIHFKNNLPQVALKEYVTYFPVPVEWRHSW